jgi:hypothetical protein
MVLILGTDQTVEKNKGVKQHCDERDEENGDQVWHTRLIRLTSRAQAQPPSGTVKSKMTNKSHKINRNWQGQRLLPAATC